MHKELGASPHSGWFSRFGQLYDFSSVEWEGLNSIQFILCSSDSKGGYDPEDIEHVNSITPSVYIIICTKQTIKLPKIKFKYSVAHCEVRNSQKVNKYLLNHFLLAD